MGDLEGHLFPGGDDSHGLALDQVRLPAPGIQFYPRTQRQRRDLVQPLWLQFGRDIHQLRHTHQVLARHQPVETALPRLYSGRFASVLAPGFSEVPSVNSFPVPGVAIMK